MAPVILWFKRDLRITDHPALAQAAAAGGPVLPLYIAEPELWAQPDASARQWDFVAACLHALRRDLARLGQPLVVRTGEAVAVLEALRSAHGAARLVSHQETGNLWTFARDRRVAAWARAAGLPWEEVAQSGVVRRLSGRDGWQTARDAFVSAPLSPTPDALPPLPGLEPGPIPEARSLRLPHDRCPHAQAGGRGRGEEVLRSFLAERGRGYRAGMSSPLGGARSCSRLSPYLAWGALSVREVAHATEEAARLHRGSAGWGGSLAAFRARLAWRDHFIQKLEDAPDLETRCLHPAYEGLRPRDSDPSRLRAWERGETGLPFVDACMRSLAATGWLNFRMRSMLMAVASYHLWLDWRATGPHLARLFTDYEPGIHWAQVQMQSGTTGMNTHRIYNPVKQGRDQDPAGVFTRAWVPELAEVPDHLLQAPWTWEGASRLLGRRYPEPLVDVAAAARAARETIWAVRQQEGFRETAAALVARHASRKRPPLRRGSRAGGGAARDGQMSFDF
ncbi:MAG: deoxyribodipyrimidine photo-lyase [Rhodobacteraceae bacterium]|nr:deoxyribodipyrimidine photo-lyase [Paracoccaceae bacterium]